jgi:phosphotransferase system enzyme I (PtsI)
MVVERRSIDAAQSAAETARLDAAILQSRKQLTKLRARLGVLPEDSQAEIAPLLDAYLQMIGPSRLVRGARRRIAEALVSAETAVVDETDTIAAAILAQPAGDDPAGRRRRAEEVREIGRRLVRNLTRAPFRSFAGLPDGAVLVVESLRPADAALLDPSRLAGVATDEGGSEGHTAIMLRALGVPAVLGVPGLTQAAQPGDTIVVDGATGRVTLNPDAESLADARRGVAAFAKEQQKYARLRRLSAPAHPSAHGFGAMVGRPPPARGGRPHARTRAGSPLPIERGAAPRCGAAVGATLGPQTGQASGRSFPRRPVLPGARP